MNQYLCSNDILLKNFGAHVEQVSHRLKTASLAEAVRWRRPVRYLASSALSKEDITRRISAEDRITHGLVRMLTCVEPCRTFEIYRNRDTKHLRLQPRVRYRTLLQPGSLLNVPKRFDFVSPDARVVGDAKYYTLVGGVGLPPAKFSIIAEHVWLLERTGGVLENLR